VDLVPVAKEPEVIIISKFFYLFLVVCHIGACLRMVATHVTNGNVVNDVGQSTVGRDLFRWRNLSTLKTYTVSSCKDDHLLSCYLYKLKYTRV
jgi:hypothetical protein